MAYIRTYVGHLICNCLFFLSSSLTLHAYKLLCMHIFHGIYTKYSILSASLPFTHLSFPGGEYMHGAGIFAMDVVRTQGWQPNTDGTFVGVEGSREPSNAKSPWWCSRRSTSPAYHAAMCMLQQPVDCAVLTKPSETVKTMHLISKTI